MLNLRKKLLVSIFTLMLALVAVSTTTYAWFTLGNEVKVSSIEMEVKGSEGLLIRVKSINGVSKSASDLYNLSTKLNLGTELSNLALEPLYHTGTTLNSLVAKGEEGSQKYGIDPTKNVQAILNTTKFIHIEFEIYSPADASITFSGLSAVSREETYSFKAQIPVISNDTTPGRVGDIDAIDKDGNITKARLANALRVAYTATPGVTDVLSTNVGTEYVEPQIYDEANNTEKANLKFQYGSWAGAAEAYFNTFSDIALDTLPTEYTYDYTSTDLNSKEIVDLDGDTENGYYATVALTIWLEGYDADCFNAIVNDEALFSLSFAVVE